MVTFTLDLWLGHLRLLETNQFAILTDLLKYLTEKLGFLVVADDLLIIQEQDILVTIKAFGLIGRADHWFT